MEFKNPFSTKRVRDVPPDEREAPAAPYGGWSDAGHNPGAGLDPVADERAQRVAGAISLAELERERHAARKAALDANLGFARRGRNYG